MGQPEFWHEQSTPETPAMRGPRVSVVLSKARGFEHALEIAKMPGSAASVSLPALVVARSATEREGEIVDRRRIGNPVYQEFVPHELKSDLGAGVCALLTGSCFDHHFSAVFSLYRHRETPHWIVFDVDVADRCRGPVEAFAATYDLTCNSSTMTLMSATASSLQWTIGKELIELVALPPAIIAHPEPSESGTRVQVQALIDPNTHTHRLHYRWLWTSCSDFTR